MQVISIEEIGFEEIVYDLETEVGTFVAGGYKQGILVKNTDSCYVKFPIHKTDFKEYGDKQNEEFMKCNFLKAEECVKYCTSQFKPPIKLAFEKFMYPLMLFAKKRYAYKEWTDPAAPDSEIHYKGLQLVRRDTCIYVKEELNHVFELIMDQTSIEEAKNIAVPYIQKSITNLLNGNVDFNKLILSKQLKSKYIVRKNKKTDTFHWTNSNIQQPHVRLAQQLMLKNPANCPKPPDRVPYLFIEKKGDNLLQCDKVIHPEEFNPDIHKIDSIYYFDHQYQKPIDMIFSFMILDGKGNPVPNKIYKNIRNTKVNQLQNQLEISSFFKVKNPVDTNTNTNKPVFKFIPEILEEHITDDEESLAEEENSNANEDFFLEIYEE